MTGNRDSTRRQVLKTIGTVGLSAALAGCSSTGGDSGLFSTGTQSDPIDTSTEATTPTETQTERPETATTTTTQPASQHPEYEVGNTVLERTELNWVQDIGVDTIFDVYSPQKFKTAWHVDDPRSFASPLFTEFFKVAGYNPVESPLTFRQPNVGPLTNIRVDTLPEGLSTDDVRRNLLEAGLENIGSTNGFDMYQGTPQELDSGNPQRAPAHAVGQNRHLLAYNDDTYLDAEDEVRAIKDSNHTKHLRTVLENHDENTVPQEIVAAQHFLDLNENHDIFSGNQLDGDGVNPVVGSAIAADMERGTINAAWVYETESEAKEAYEEFRKSYSQVMYERRSLELTGRAVTARGEGVTSDSTFSPEAPPLLPMCYCPDDG